MSARRTSTRRISKSTIPALTLEPFQLTIEEAVERLKVYEDPSVRTDEATIRALRGMGLRIVRACDFCAKEHPDGRIPACPHVATVMVDVTEGRHLMGGHTYMCAPHARGEDVAVRLKTSRKRR